MSSPYAVLNNRPIDQWKVTELKEELRRRRLKINGLKEDLVKRLDGALRLEMEEAEKEAAKIFPADDDDAVEKVDDGEPATQLVENIVEPVQNKVDEVVQRNPTPFPEENNAEPAENQNAQVDCDTTMVDNSDSRVDANQDMKDQDQKEMGHTGLDAILEDATNSDIPLQMSVTDNETGVGQLESYEQEERYDEANKDPKPPAEDVVLVVSESTNQVSEVIPDLGSEVKSASISSDSVSINEKNELKDNLNANNVNLELEVVKADMVQPSSNEMPTLAGDSQPLQDGKDLIDHQVSLEEAGDFTCARDMEFNIKVESVDEGSLEKLNLDRSSGDESMEEDVLEIKQIESKNSFEEGEKKNDVMVGNPLDTVVGVISPEKKDIIFGEENKATAGAEKRKVEDSEVVRIDNVPKRRRWNSDNFKAPEPQNSSVSTSIPKDVSQPALRKSFSRSDSSVSEDVPKERIVPPSPKPPTTSLRVDRFLRPFTLKAVQELLAKTGSVTDFWMDQIKTHCYVTYSSVEEATATRNALYNLQWPINGGRLLMAEFVDPQEVKMRLEAPPPSPAPITPSSTSTPTAPPFQRQQQHLPPPPPPPALSNPPLVRERLPAPPPLAKKPDPPIMTLDDLFKKTKATPRIYYLPLSEEQVAAKLQADQGKKVTEEM